MNNSPHQSMTERSEVTLQRLEAALQRLVNGSPDKTPNDGKINISRINDEAGLSAGSIYYYKSFIERAKRTIEDTKNNCIDRTNIKTISADGLRKQREEEKRLKEKYRKQRDEIKLFCDQVVAKNANLEFALFEALEQIQQLQEEIKSIKVVDINRGKQP